MVSLCWLLCLGIINHTQFYTIVRGVSLGEGVVSENVLVFLVNFMFIGHLWLPTCTCVRFFLLSHTDLHFSSKVAHRSSSSGKEGKKDGEPLPSAALHC